MASLAPYKDWHYLPTSQEEAVSAYIISELSQDPKIPIAHACAMLKAPMLIDLLMKAIRIAHKDASLMSLSAGVEAEKKDSDAIAEPQDLNGSAETSGAEATPI